MKLYYFETPNPRKPCAVAKHLDSPVEYHRVDLASGENRTPEYLAVNPNGKVPALSDGDVALWESSAIMAYLADKAGSDLWPTDTAGQIDVLRWIAWDASHFSRHAGTLFFQNLIKPRFTGSEPDSAAVEEATGFFRQFAGVLNDHLSNHDYVVADRLTITDFALACTLPEAADAKIPLDDFPKVAAWHDRLMELPAWREPFPSA